MLASKNYIQEKEVKWATELAGMCKNHAEKPKRASRKLWPSFSAIFMLLGRKPVQEGGFS